MPQSTATPTPSASGTSPRSASTPWALEVNSLDYRYHDGTPALRQVSFRVQEGDCVGLIGPNGAGKSTLLLHLNGILPESLPSPPVLRVFGLPLNPENLPAIRRQVGLLFQDPDDQLFCPTVFEDVAFGPRQFVGPDRAALDALVSAALAQVGLPGFEKRVPHHLSHGEKRRVCLAGVLACQPRLLVLDEPTSDLDPRARRELLGLLRQIKATQIIATHDLALVQELCHRVLVLDQGRIVGDGSPAELLGNHKLLLAHGLA